MEWNGQREKSLELYQGVKVPIPEWFGYFAELRDRDSTAYRN